MTAADPEIYSIGHSNHGFDRFLELLRAHAVTAVADVRSAPYSRFAPWSSRTALAKQLPLLGIEYVFLGEQLGGRPASDEFEGVEDRAELYRRIAQTAGFREGLDRLEKGAERYRVALLCSEEDPAICHRHNLIAPELRKRGFAVRHIRRDGSVQPAEDVVSARGSIKRDNQATQVSLLP